MKRGGQKICDVCGGAECVLSVYISLVPNHQHRCQIPVQHICEDCILVMPQFAKLAGEISGNDSPTLAQQFSEIPTKRRLAFFILADVIKASWCRWRGGAAA